MRSNDVEKSADVRRGVPACLQSVVPIRPSTSTVSAALYDCILETLTGELDCPLAAMMLEAGRDEAPRATGGGPMSCVDRLLGSPDGPHDTIFLQAIDDCVERSGQEGPCPLRRALATASPDT
jgi:hypothetical protein